MSLPQGDWRPLRKAYYRRTVRYGVALVYAGPIFLCVSWALGVGPGHPSPTERLVYLALALPFAVLAYRQLRIGVYPRADGVLIRHILRNQRLPWSEIDRFEWGIWRGWGSFPCGIVRLRNGSQVTISALNPPLEIERGQDPVVPRLLEGLNEEVSRARAAGLAGRPSATPDGDAANATGSQPAPARPSS